MENTPYQEKVAKNLNDRQLEKIVQHKENKERKKKLTAEMRPVKKVIRDAEKRIIVLQDKIEKNKQLLLRINVENN